MGQNSSEILANHILILHSIISHTFEHVKHSLTASQYS